MSACKAFILGKSS